MKHLRLITDEHTYNLFRDKDDARKRYAKNILEKIRTKKFEDKSQLDEYIIGLEDYVDFYEIVSDVDFNELEELANGVRKLRRNMSSDEVQDAIEFLINNGLAYIPFCTVKNDFIISCIGYQELSEQPKELQDDIDNCFAELCDSEISDSAEEIICNDIQQYKPKF